MKTEEDKIAYKQQLKAACIELLHERLQVILDAMEQSQQSANNEDKSSAGDKHETSRAMSQLDNEMQAKQLEEVRHELQLIEPIDVSKTYGKGRTGAVVVCKHNTFFVAAGLGAQTLTGQKVVFISPHAPLALLFKDKKKGDLFLFNKVEYSVVDVF